MANLVAPDMDNNIDPIDFLANEFVLERSNLIREWASGTNRLACDLPKL
jgi:hypothetical protein